MADILGIGTSGLLAFQRALTTTSHNISNSNTEGYSRQRVGMGTQTPEFIGVGYAGTGVRVMEITRNFDNFLTTQLRNQTSNNERYTAFYDLASQIDNMLADQNSGLGPMMDEFFAATQGVADNPNSIPARQVLLTSAESLSDRFHYLDQRLRDLNTRVNQQLDAGVYDINTLASGIAQMNEDIALARGAAGGADPNDLLDRRDLLINQLSELVDIKTVEQNDGMVNIFIGTGQGLVVGKDTLSLSVEYDELVQGKASVMLGEGSGSVDISRLLSGGKIGGTLDFANTILDESRNSLGRIAVGISEQFNEIHQLGIDLTGQLGGNFFTSLEPQVFVPRTPPNSDPNADLDVSYVDASKLTTKDYLLRFDGTNWRLTDYKTGQQLATAAPAEVLEYDGFRVDLNSVVPVAGDRYLIRPTNSAASLFGVEVEDPTRIAAASALQGSEIVTAQGMASNLGTGVISNVNAVDRDILPLTGDISLQYDGTDFTVTGFTDPVASFSYDAVNDGGAEFKLYRVVDALNNETYEVIKNGDPLDPNNTYSELLNFTLSGQPAINDSFTVGNNTDAVGDNRNALAMAALQTQKGMMNGSATFQATYGQMVSRVGTQAHQASINKDATHTLRTQAENAVQSVSGVNLDEEAANLIRFQQAYQANAQMISVANQLFQTLLQAF